MQLLVEDMLTQKKTQTTHRSQKTLTVILKFVDGELNDYSYNSTSF